MHLSCSTLLFVLFLCQIWKEKKNTFRGNWTNFFTREIWWGKSFLINCTLADSSQSSSEGRLECPCWCCWRQQMQTVIKLTVRELQRGPSESAQQLQQLCTHQCLANFVQSEKMNSICPQPGHWSLYYCTNQGTPQFQKQSSVRGSSI